MGPILPRLLVYKIRYKSGRIASLSVDKIVCEQPMFFSRALTVQSGAAQLLVSRTVVRAQACEVGM